MPVLPLVPSTIAAGVMATLVWLARDQLEMLGAPLAVRIALTGVLGLVSYLVLLRIVSAPSFHEMIAMISKMSPKLRRLLKRMFPASQPSGV